MRSADELTTRARIRDAAVLRFGQDGFAATTVRSIAQDARVSPGLVIHHFGSKEGLRRACDAHLIAAMTSDKTRALEGSFDATAMVKAFEGAEPLIAYFARAFTDAGDHAAPLFDSLVDMAEQLLLVGEEAGTIRPGNDQRARATLLTVWGLSLLVFGEHVGRVLGSPAHSLTTLMRLDAVVLDIYTHGLLADERLAKVFDEASAMRDVSIPEA